MREFTTGDAEFVLELMNEPAYIQFIGDRGVTDLSLAESYIAEKFTASYSRNGFGFWMVERLDDGEAIGMCGLAKRDFLEAPDIGFAFLERFRGQGYARESANGVLAYASDVLDLPTIMAFTDPGNERSSALLTSIGLGSKGLRFIEELEEDLTVFEVN